MSQCSRDMLEQTTRRKARTSWVDAAFEDHSRLFFAMVVLLVALVVVLVKDRDFWFGDSQTTVADEIQWVPGSVKDEQPAAPPATKEKKHVAATKSAAQPATPGHAVIATNRTAVPPLEVDVVAGGTPKTIHLGNNSVKVEIPSDSAQQGPATVAAERVPMSVEKAPARRQPVQASYPLLGRQMKVQGSVLLQAFIGADGFIRELRVLSGPSILASAAREAARQWQFKPYMQNGQAVETQANITVNFTINVLDNGTKDQMDNVIAQSSRGE